MTANPNHDSSQAFLRIDGVRKRFGRFNAVDRVSLDVRRGEFVCILGPSGCGKSTLLRMVAGFEQQDEGRIWLQGTDLSPLPPARRDCGMVFQSYALFPNLTALQNAAYGLMHGRMSRAAARDRALEMLGLVGLGDMAGKYPAQLSGGEQQRVALARALATNPSLLLLDEPLSALDARVRVHLRREIRSLQHRLGVTTVMVTHDQEEALTMADRVVVMEGGRLVQEGPPRAVYQAPADAFVAGFVGSMNFLPARLAEGGRVMLGGTTLSATCVASGAPGSTVTVAVRPEDIHLATGKTNGNALYGRVLSVEFRGPVYRLRVALDPAGETQVEVDVRRGMVEAGDLAEDNRVALHIPPEGLMVFPAEAAPVSGAAD